MKAVWADSENSHQREELQIPGGFAQKTHVTCQKPTKPHTTKGPRWQGQTGKDKRGQVKLGENPRRLK